ncbi:MAG TPA: flagellar hook capping FlgD N-terminal domain-containing protein [Stellaceae bacterium]|nr:flagellar hook capping FlgD N-terminal domain-containing protein [Stellaceae bacterium]
MTTTTGVNVTPPPTSSSTTGVPDFTSNFNTFLTLLTTQLQNQDPLSPVDTSQFTQQLVGFSEVEQQINTNKNLQQLIQLQTSNEAIAATPLVGQTIQYSGATAPLAGGQAGFSYSLPSNAANVNLLVEDASGNVVFSTGGNTNAGTHDFVWNGKSSSGAQMPDGGQYTLQVVATDASKNPITATVSSFGVVNGVSIANNQATLNLSGVSVPLSELLAINPTINTSL